MKKVILLATAALLFTGLAFANHGDKGKGKKCGKGKTCCSKDSKGKSCGKDKKDKTAKVQ